MNIFVDKDKEIKIGISIIENGEDFTVEAFAVTAEDAKTCDFLFVFRYPSYKDTVEILDEALSVTGETIKLKSHFMRYKSFITLLKSWDLVDLQDNPMPVTEENIGRLSPLVADRVMDVLEKFLGTNSILEDVEKDPEVLPVSDQENSV